MIGQSVKPTTSKTHFMHENGETYCGSEHCDSDTYIVITNCAREASGFFIDEHLCGVCWCVWLSITHDVSHQD